MKNGETALHLAAQHCSPGTVKMLLNQIQRMPTELNRLPNLTKLKLTNNKLSELPDLELPALERSVAVWTDIAPA